VSPSKAIIYNLQHFTSVSSDVKLLRRVIYSHLYSKYTQLVSRGRVSVGPNRKGET